MAIPVETRRAAVESYKRGEGSQAAVSRQFGVSEVSLRRWVARDRRGESLEPRKGNRGPAFMLDEQDCQALRDILASNPTMPLVDVLGELTRTTGKSPSLPTLRRTLTRLGLGRRPLAVQAADDTPARPPRDGYKEAHRRTGRAGGYSSDTTDAEWEEIRGLFEREGRRGRPPKYDLRWQLDAMFYIVRSGCAWRMLPHEYPPWDVVYASFRRWSERGLLEQMYDRLRERWRVREGRNAQPSAAIIDSQSVKTTEKGGLEAMTAARRSRVENAISL